MNVHTPNAVAELAQAEALHPLGPRSYNGVNWLGLKTLYMKEVRRFFKVQTQTIWAPAITTLLQLMIFTLALGQGGRMVLGVPFAGSHLLLILGCLLFLIRCLMQGLLISVATRQQQLAMQLSLMVGMLPSFMLSGFIFPIESMPLFFRILTRILSPRWFMVISRGVFLKDASLVELAGPLLALAAIATFFTAMAVKRFKADLEP